MPKRTITDCSLEDIERVLRIKYDDKLVIKESTPNSKLFNLGRTYKLIVEKHRDNHVKINMKLQTWFIIALVIGAIILTPALGGGLVLIIILLLYLFLWMPRKFKNLQRSIEKSIRSDQELTPIVEGAEVVYTRKDDAFEKFAMRYCIKCGEKIRADSIECPKCHFVAK